MNKWAQQVLQAETDKQIAHAQRMASGLQMGDLTACLEILAETTPDDDTGGQYIIEVLTELVIQCKAAGYSHSDYIAIGDSPQALADSNARRRALEAVLIEQAATQRKANMLAEKALQTIEESNPASGADMLTAEQADKCIDEVYDILQELQAITNYRQA